MKRFLLSERIQKAPRRLTIEPYLRDGDQPIESSPQARPPRIVPLVIADYGSLIARFKQSRYIGGLLLKAIREMMTSASSIRENPREGRTHIDPGTLAELQALARELGVAEIGFTRVNPKFIFRGFRILYPNAIVLTMEMDREKIRQSPSRASFIEVFRTYYQLGVVVNRLASFLRSRGFNAHAGPAVGGDVNYIPVARDAGLGEMGRNGLLVTRAHGPRVRLAAVYTDIENLPDVQRTSLEWIHEYCEACNLCVTECPAGALTAPPRTLQDGGPAYVDHTRCAVPFSNDDGCTICIKVCPLANAPLETLHAQLDRRHHHLSVGAGGTTP